MKKKPLVSVIIASYNHEKYIKDAVKSVLNQTYTNIELIVVDDNSTDNTVKEIKKIKDKRLRTYFLKENKGSARIFNYLVSLCKGEYIAILGSDDIWYKDKLEIQMPYFSNNKVGAVFSLVDIIDENNIVYEDNAIFNNDIFVKDQGSRGKWLRLFYESGNHLCHPTSIIKKSVIEEIGEYNILLRQLHDFDYWVRLINNYDIKVVEQKLMAYRRFRNNEQNLSINSYKNQIRLLNECYLVIRNMFKEIKSQVLIEGFKDLFINKNATSKEELEYEKFFILKNLKIMGINNKSLAFDMIFERKDTNKFINNLERKYGYALQNLYEDMGKTVKSYPNEYYIHDDKELTEIYNISKNYSLMAKEIENMRNSKSWKITKPIRKISKIMGDLKKWKM